MITKICKHKDHVGERDLPITKFRKQKRNKDGLASQCKTCADRISIASHAKRPGHKTKIAKQRRKKLLAKYRKWKSDIGCKCCPEVEGICLELHHLDPNKKEINPSDMLKNGWSWKKIMKEAVKCIVLCSNCHKKVHAKLINLKNYK